MSIAQEPLFDPKDFHFQPDVTHVCAAGETAFLRSHESAIARYIRDKSSGPKGRVAQESQVERARVQVADLWCVQPGDIGWVSNVAEGVSIVLESLSWSQDDQICVMPNEYPSLVAPVIANSVRAGKVRFSERASAQSLADAINDRTKVVLISYVSYLNGERYDLETVRKAADRVGALMVVDFTQASGYMPIDATVADFAFSASYKWMLGTTGAATAFWNRSRQSDWAPSSAGWYSLATDGTSLSGGVSLRPDAMRFTRGNPAHLSIYILSNALDYLGRHEPAAIQAHVQALTADLQARLRSHGIESSTPFEPARHGASVCLSRPDAKSIQIFLNDCGVLAWNGRGRLRVSFHGYNCRRDVDKVEEGLLRALRSLSGSRREPVGLSAGSTP